MAMKEAFWAPEDQTARLVALQNIAFAGIVSELTASVDELERRVGSSI